LLRRVVAFASTRSVGWV